MTSNLLRSFLIALATTLAASTAWAAIGHSVIVEIFEPVATIAGPVGTTDGYGRSVDTEGDLTAVGSPGFNAWAEDSVLLYRRTGDDFTLEQTIRYADVPGAVADLPPTLPGRFPRGAKFGDVVLFDGSRLIVGAVAPSHGGVQAVYVFAPGAGGELVYRQTLVHPTQSVTQPTDGGSSCTPCFGRNLAADAGTLVISGGGSFVYQWTGSQYQLETQLAPGSPLAIDDDTLVVGTAVFQRTGGIWQPRSPVVIPATGISCASAALDGDRLVYGCGGNTGSPSSAWLFERSGSGFGPAVQLSVPGASTLGFERFGRSVAISGDTLAVSSGQSVWLFQDDGAGWRDVRKIDGIDAGAFIGETLVAKRERIYASPGLGSPCASCFGSVGLYEESYAGINETLFHGLVRAELFVPDAEREGRDPVSAAYRYVHTLYPTPAPGTEPKPDYGLLPTLFTQADFDRSMLAEEAYVEALRSFAAPPAILSIGLLDVVHHRTVLAQLLAAQRLAEADEVRLGLSAPAPCDQGETIDREICLAEQALLAYEWAIQGGFDPASAAAGRGYFDLLQDDLGAPRIAGEPLGYAAFRLAAPLLCVLPARYLDVNGDPQSLGSGCLYDIGPNFDNGYRDVIVMMGLLRDTARAAARLAQLLVAKGDVVRAGEVIADSQSMLLSLGEIVLGVFPGIENQIDANSGVLDSIGAWRDGLAELTTLASLVRGGGNALAFDDDFLIFLPGLPEVGPTVFDSYDRFAAYVEATPTRPLRAARIALNGDGQSAVGAKQAYADFQGGQDAVEAQLASLSTTVGNRLAEIVGAHPNSPFYLSAQDDPRVFGGSGEVAQQLLSLDAAVLVIERNRQEIRNLHAKVQIERARSSTAQNVVIDFGDRQASLTEEIGQIEAAQAVAEATAESLTSLGSNPFQLIIGIGAGAANAAAQGALSELKAGKEARKERLAALERADLIGINSQAQVRTWLLDMSLLAIDSQEAALLLRQETARLKALVDEKNRLETQLGEARSALVLRYFADPIHRLRAEADVRRALISFDRGQRWLYYMVRALEYKWNVDFHHVDPVDGRVWTADSVFATRNADELDAFYQAMEDFNQDRIFTTFQPQLGVISLRDDLLGIASEQEFDDYLAQLPRDAFGDAVIHFNTAREFPQAGLFLRSTTLDKIDRMVISLPGNHTQATDFGTLKYAGTSLVRTVNRPLPGPSSDAQPDELRSYSTRSWRSDLVSGDLVATDGLQVPTQLVLNGARPSNCSTPGIDWIESFKERSVAATGWELSIPARLLGRIDDVEILVCHRWAPRGF